MFNSWGFWDIFSTVILQTSLNICLSIYILYYSILKYVQYKIISPIFWIFWSADQKQIETVFFRWIKLFFIYIYIYALAYYNCNILHKVDLFIVSLTQNVDSEFKFKLIQWKD